MVELLKNGRQKLIQKMGDLIKEIWKTEKISLE